MASHAAGARYTSLLGGSMISFYDWYADLPIASPQVFGDQTDVPESADWWNASYLIMWGSNIPVTRTPDAHFMTEARYRGQKVVAVSPDYAVNTKFADEWMAAHPGTDGAVAMAMGHVVLKEFFVERRVPRFKDYVTRFSDLPFLVTLRRREGQESTWPIDSSRRRTWPPRGRSADVGDDQAAGEKDVEFLAGERAAKLCRDDLDRSAGFALIEQLADAKDRAQAGREGAGQLLADELIALELVAAALRVAEDDPGGQAAEHHGGDLAGVGAALLVVDVLGTDGDVLAGESLVDGGQADVWRADDSSNARFLRSGGDGRGKLSGVRGGGVHLPVGSNNHRSHSGEF